MTRHELAYFEAHDLIPYLDQMVNKGGYRVVAVLEHSPQGTLILMAREGNNE